VWQQFKRDLALQLFITRAIDHTHPAFADPIQKTVVSENFAENGLGSHLPPLGLVCSGKPIEVAAGIVTLDGWKSKANVGWEMDMPG
jgi:hypothetical protein